MRDIIQSSVFNSMLCLTKNNENFSDKKENYIRNVSILNLIASVISVVIVYALILLLGKYLWNNYLVEVSDSIKPIESLWTLLGISVLFKLLA